MKKLILLSFAIVFAAHAAPAQDLAEARKAAFEKFDSCDQAIFSDSEWLAASLPGTANGLGHVRLQSLVDSNRSLDLPASDRVVDLKIQNGTLYVLTETTLEGWEINGAKSLFNYPTHPGVTHASYWGNKATGFVLSADRAVIAHGALGFSVLDLHTGAVARLIAMPTNSSATDIALLDDKTAVASVDNNVDAAFHGFYLIDLTSLTITKQVKVENEMPTTVRVLPGDRLILGYINAIWKFDLNKAISGSEAKPASRYYPVPDTSDLHGKLFFDEKYVYACEKFLFTGNAQDFHPIVLNLTP